MTTANVRDYYKLVRRATAELNGEVALEQFSATVIRGIARCMDGAASLLLLDSTGKKLVHSTSWKLPQSYLKKGVLDARKSITEVIKGQPIAIEHVRRSRRLQYREQAIKAGFASILAIPIDIDGCAIGSIRVYLRQQREFTNNEVAFIKTMTGLMSLALERMYRQSGGAELEDKTLPGLAVLADVKKTRFQHPSEEEFASILNFYNIEWVYEPRSFAINWNDDGVTQMFTPDFYLPRFDLYIELTTMKQRSITTKNRKLRRLRHLYPDVKITLLNKKNFEHMLARFGSGPLAESKGHGVGDVLYSAAQIRQRVSELAQRISADYVGKTPLLIGMLRGVLCFMSDLVQNISIPINVDLMSLSSYKSEQGKGVQITKDIGMDIVGKHVIMVEDIVDTGITIEYIVNQLRLRKPRSIKICTLLDKKVRRLADVKLDYVGFEIPDEFVIGYGLDFKEEYRNLPFIGILKSTA
ncbi:hypoxanthine phosphoribosyltransferase [Chloroflexota bacterium]